MLDTTMQPVLFHYCLLGGSIGIGIVIKRYVNTALGLASVNPYDSTVLGLDNVNHYDYTILGLASVNQKMEKLM